MNIEFPKMKHFLFVGEAGVRNFALRCEKPFQKGEYYSLPVITVWGEAGYALVDHGRIMQVIFSVYHEEEKDKLASTSHILAYDYMPRTAYNIREVNLLDAHKTVKLLSLFEKITDIPLMTLLKFNQMALGVFSDGQLNSLKRAVGRENFDWVMNLDLDGSLREKAIEQLSHFGIKAV